MNNMPAMPHMQQVHPSHPNRRQNDYHYSPQPHHPQHYPYPAFPHPSHYPAPPPPHHYIPQPYYIPYQQYASPPHQYPRHHQQQSPLVVSSHPHSQPLPSLQRQSSHPRHHHAPPPLAKTPQLEPSTSSTTSQVVVSPSTTPTTTSANASTPPIQASKSSATAPSTSGPREPFYPKLPWLSVPEAPFPPRSPRRRRKKKIVQLPCDLPEFPSRSIKQESEPQEQDEGPSSKPIPGENEEQTTPPPAAPLPELSSEKADSQPSTSSPESGEQRFSKGHRKAPTKPVVPVVPIAPSKPVAVATPAPSKPATAGPESDASKAEVTEAASEKQPSPTILPPVKAPPKSWAELLRSKVPTTNIPRASNSAASSVVANGLQAPKNTSLSDALRLYDVHSESKISFLEPRGLVNTGNMCYMNSILQILVFCAPFFEFLDQVGKRAVHNFRSDTPLIEVMITFMREFSVIDSAHSVEQLRLRLKDNDYEQYGEAFIPEFVYDVINRLPRFSTMRRGHQQDAEEFLGFFLEGLHDECVQVMKKESPEAPSSNTSEITTPNASDSTAEIVSSHNPADKDGGWLEVGPKQRPSVTRSSGAIATESPITKIFGGKLRSEFRVPGLKNSVTLEPYQPLQLDIGDPSVSNISDALKGLTRSETIHGNFNSPRGPGATAIKQVFIETLPPVLILHLKRFHYDTSSTSGIGSTQKIWKRVGYPLELEIPREVFSQSRRAQLSNRPQGLPKYRLISVVYHHGKNASGGHYTVDVRRQEGREWVRFDDTVVRRVRSEDVASEGGEEDPKVLAAALERHRRENQQGSRSNANANIYKQAGFGEDSEDASNQNNDDADGWSQVNGNATSPPNIAASSTNKKWSSVANGNAMPSSSGPPSGKRTPTAATAAAQKASLKENKVAYILFYQRINE